MRTGSDRAATSTGTGAAPHACGVPPERFAEVCRAWTENSGRERTTALVYSVGWTQHSVGVQYIRTGAIIQLLLGNMGRPGGGILALRGLSFDNTGALSANSWRHVAFIEQPATGAEREAQFLGMPSFDLPGRDGQAERTDFRWLMMSDVCKHCTHAACLDVCPTGALFRTEFGTVVVQEDICNGCGYCVSACPYGVIDRREDDGRVSCDAGRACCRRPAAGSRGFQPAGRADGRWPRRPVTACRPRLRRRLATP